jgi:O-antigen/teichoic acid export membrane protein
MKNETQKAIKNSAFNLVGYLYPLIFALILTPLLIFNLGTAKYGVFIFITTVAGFLSILTTGFDAGIIRQIAQYRLLQKNSNIKNLTKTINLINLCIGISTALFIVGGFFLGNAVIKESSLFSFEDLMILFFLSALNILFQSSARLYQTICIALERFDINTKIGILNLTLLNIGFIVLALTGYDLISLFVWQLVIGIITTIIFYVVSIRLAPETRYRIGFKKEELSSFLSFGFFNTLNEIAKTSLASLDKILIPLFTGSVMLTYYSVPSNLSSRVVSTAGNLSNIIFPLSTRLYTGGENERLSSLYVRSSRLITSLSFAIGFAIIFNAKEIMRYWLDETFVQNSSYILIVLVLSNIILSLYSNITYFLSGINKIKIVVMFSIAMAIINAVSLFVLVPLYGIMGAAIAYSISIFPVLIIIYVVEKNFLTLLGRSRYYSIFLLKHLTVAATVFIIHSILLKYLITNLFTLALIGPVTIALYLFLYALGGFFDKEDMADFVRFMKSIIINFRNMKNLY